MTTFNINDHVWLKLTDKGREIHRESLKDYPELLKYVETDADGWTRFQLWEAMQVFGARMVMGSELSFETTIRLETP
jgi:hypothetical protein